MAIFNATLISGNAPAGAFKAFAETTGDLAEPAAAVWLPGSAVVCLNTDGDGKPTVHVKLPDGSWSGVEAEV